MTIPVEGYPGIVGVSAKGKVFEGEQVPVNKRMMEKEDAEQVSEEVFGKLFRGVALHSGVVAYTFNMSGYFDFIVFF
jgi:propanediol utilization protein